MSLPKLDEKTGQSEARNAAQQSDPVAAATTEEPDNRVLCPECNRWVYARRGEYSNHLGRGGLEQCKASRRLILPSPAPAADGPTPETTAEFRIVRRSRYNELIRQRDEARKEVEELRYETELLNQTIRLGVIEVEERQRRLSSLQSQATRDAEEIKRLKGALNKWDKDYDATAEEKCDAESERDELIVKLSATEAECTRLKAERDRAITELVNAKQAWLDSADPDKGPYVPWEDHAAVTSERDAADARVAELSVGLTMLRHNVGHVAHILITKRESDDSTIHAGNTAFMSMERWASESITEIDSLLTAPTRTEGKAEARHVLCVEKDRVPAGAELVECYRIGNKFIVMGDPDPDDEAHNCDAMGCGTLSHVLAIFTR